ncbi:uncharacterized protein B0H64DRAFT_375135 [Chaetomium fimeti]|uniref:Uncharacterized protein n=1 Tax=Chaetomium fimeti TaxID=1854472 RepID=A0AAE0HD09_9PEZI|nr:hypothetical protein B0H64DRAFT_375135 [Chaetomium fimeti]
MDWPLEDPAFFDKDLDNLYCYEQRRSKAVYRFEGDVVLMILQRLCDTDEDVSRWLKQLEHSLAARAEQPDIQHNPAILEYLPFSRESFKQIVTCLPLHGDTARVVNRYNMAFFTSIDLLDSPANALFHILRTTATHPGDLALSSVSHPTTQKQKGPDTSNLNNTNPSNTNPSNTNLNNTNLNNTKTKTKTKTKTRIKTKNKSKTPKTPTPPPRKKPPSSQPPSSSAAPPPTPPPSPPASHAPQARPPPTPPTTRSSSRAWAEYEVYGRECSMVIEGMALSAQLSWSQIGYQDAQANLKIASDAREDSKQMRSIAFLTMVFLPATFLATVFSTTFFNWKPGEGECCPLMLDLVY